MGRGKKRENVITPERVRAIRKATGLSQMAFARRANEEFGTKWRQGTIAAWECAAGQGNSMVRCARPNDVNEGLLYVIEGTWRTG